MILAIILKTGNVFSVLFSEGAERHPSPQKDSILVDLRCIIIIDRASLNP